MSLSSILPRPPRTAAFLLTFAALATSAGTAHADEPAPPAKTEAPAKAEPKRSAGITVHVVEGARVLVDRADAGRAEPGQPFELTLPPGDYTVRVVYDGGGNEEASAREARRNRFIPAGLSARDRIRRPLQTIFREGPRGPTLQRRSPADGHGSRSHRRSTS